MPARLESPERVYHVLMSTGGDEAIEAVHEQNVVRRVQLAQRLGIPLRDLDASGKTQRLMVQGDPHPTGKFRVIGPLSDFPEFQKAFACPADAPMVRPPGTRCEVW